MPPATAPQEQQEQQSASSLLLALPEPLLLAVLQCLAAANDHSSLFGAARAHSRLHQAAAAVLSSITVQEIRQQQVLDGVLLYLSKHGQHVHSVHLAGPWDGPPPPPTLTQLPPTLQLHSLELGHLKVQLLPGAGSQGVLGYGGVSALKQLQLEGCTLVEDRQGLQAALELLPPGLEDLVISSVQHDEADSSPATIPMGVLQQRLQQLTYLDLTGVELQGAEQPSPALQPLPGLSRLVDLQLCNDPELDTVLTAGMLSGAAGLTSLQLHGIVLDPGALAGKTRLQHLSLCQDEAQRNADWTAQLLAQLGTLQQLTYLSLYESLLIPDPAPAAAYSALTASSKLRELSVTRYQIPTGAWQHVFPAGRQLPHLTLLSIAHGQQPSSWPMAAPEGSRLVSCCPGLQRLRMHDLAYSAGAFASLQGLTGLSSLTVSLDHTGEALREVCQLTGVRDLEVFAPFKAAEGLMLQTTHLRQLTSLALYKGPHNCRIEYWTCGTEAPGDEPVWRQVLRRHLNHSDPAVAQQAAAAAAALAEAD